MTCLRNVRSIALSMLLAGATARGDVTAPGVTPSSTPTVIPATMAVQAGQGAASTMPSTPVVVPPPFSLEKAYSADVEVALKNGLHLRGHMNLDNDKLRADWSMNGTGMAAIVRKDQMKIYDLLPMQKIAMVMDLDASRLKGNEAAVFGPEGKFELIGPDTIDGVACTKYRVTSDKNGSVVYYWLDTVHKVPVAVASPDGAFTAKWTNYKQGPQEPALFEVPADYNLMPMPTNVGMPNGQ